MPTGATLAPQGAAILPTGATVAPQGAAILPAGAMLAPLGAVCGELGNSRILPDQTMLARLQRPRIGASKLALTGEASFAKRGGVCNPAAYVLGELLTQREAQNVSDGITNPVRLRGHF